MTMSNGQKRLSGCGDSDVSSSRMREKKGDAGKIGSFESAAWFSRVSEVVNTTRRCIL